VTGSHRELVGRTAADIRGFRPPEPYKGKGIKYIDETIIRKVGKAAGGK
jgi:large subunit ribosomal protein L6